MAFQKEVVLWMVQHKARLIYWSFTEKDMLNYGFKGLLMFFSSFDFKLLSLSLILIFLPKVILGYYTELEDGLNEKNINIKDF